MIYSSIEIFRIVAIFLVSFLLTLSIFPLWYAALLRWRLGKQIRTDAPVFQSIHAKKSGTPSMGGAVIWLVPALMVLLAVFLAPVNSFADWLNFFDRRETYLPLGFLVLAGLLGGIDDLLGIFKIGPKGGGMGMREKILIYVAIGLVVAWWFILKLGITFLPLPFGERLYLGPLGYFAFIIFFVLALSFSANETDGLDGLLAGIGLITILALAIISFFNGNYHLAALSASLLGAILAFSWFNLYPAKVFMGDTGSMAIGIYLALVFLLEGIPLLAPIMLPIFIIESGSVIIQLASKKFRKKKVFLSSPIHHHFEALGNHETTIVFKFWLVSAVAVAVGLMVFILDRYV